MSEQELLTQAESLGLSFSRLGAAHGRRWSTYTRNGETAEAMREAGAKVETYRATRWHGTEAENARFDCWCIEILPDTAEDAQTSREKGA